MPVLRSCLPPILALFLLAIAPAIRAQPAPTVAPVKTKVEVRTVQFNRVASPITNALWFEADIQLDVQVTGGRSQFADRVKVTLNLGTRTLGGAYRFYRADLEAVALENGPAHFRFYLPPEVVKRDGLAGGEPEFWSVKISTGGEIVPDAGRNTSVTLHDPERLKNFEGRIAADAPANDGVLIPQHLSPFALTYPTATPSAVRRLQ